MRSSGLRAVLLILILPWIGSCFDYKERIVFKKAWSGYVEMSYSVPVFPASGQSMIGFLPVRKSDVESHFSRLLFTRRVENYRVYYLQRASGPLPDRARVSFRIAFDGAGELAQILPGKASVVLRRNRLRIQRELSRGDVALENELPLLANYAERIHSGLEGHRLEWQITFPPEMQVETSGQLFGQQASMSLPLSATLKEGPFLGFTTELKVAASAAEVP